MTGSFQRKRMIGMFLTAILLTVLRAERSAAVDPPEPDLTGFWIGTYVSDFSPTVSGEAAMRIDSQDRSRFTGQLSLDLQGFNLQGTALVDPPEPDVDPPEPDVDPPEPDHGARGDLLIFGRDPTARRAQITIRGNVDEGSIAAEYLATLPDGSRDRGVIMLFRIDADTTER